MCIEEPNNYFIIRLGIVSVLGRGSPGSQDAVRGGGRQPRPSPVLASPQDPTATLGSDGEGFPAGHFVRPHGWFLVCDTGCIICSAFASPAEDGEAA